MNSALKVVEQNPIIGYSKILFKDTVNDIIDIIEKGNLHPETSVSDVILAAGYSRSSDERYGSIEEYLTEEFLSNNPARMLQFISAGRGLDNDAYAEYANMHPSSDYSEFFKLI